MRIANWAPGRCRKPSLAASPLAAGALALALALGAGCSHSKKGSRGGAFTMEPVPPVPVFLNGPMALLLTNGSSFHARAVLEIGSPPQQTFTGELMGQGGSLVFAPVANSAADKRSSSLNSAFIWDVPANRGYLLNDPMQAYAPISSSRQFTNVVTGAAPSSSQGERVAGHTCQPCEAVVAASDGTITAFRVWRASDLNGLPLRITCTSAGAPQTLTLSKARVAALPGDLFQPPAGFTKYDSAEALVSELAARRYKLKSRPSYQPAELEKDINTDLRRSNMP